MPNDGTSAISSIGAAGASNAGLTGYSGSDNTEKTTNTNHQLIGSHLNGIEQICYINMPGSGSIWNSQGTASGIRG